MLKIIALITMILDHIGLFWNINWLRIVGRLSFPIYCFLITKGIKKTKNIKQYMIRILILAIISQCIWQYMGYSILNVLFTYFLFIQLIYFLKNKNNIMASLIFLICILASPILDYGFYGFALLVIFYYTDDKLLRFILMFASSIYFVDVGLLNIISFVALISIFIIDKYDKDKYYKKYKKYNKLIYWMYPVHLMLLFELHKLF